MPNVVMPSVVVLNVVRLSVVAPCGRDGESLVREVRGNWGEYAKIVPECV
jgi:hypothetical protein